MFSPKSEFASAFLQEFAAHPERQSKFEEVETPTHVDVHASALFGFAVNSIPFPQFDMGPRITFAATMMKSAQGASSSVHDLRMDNLSYVLFYPERPLVSTFLMNVLGLSRFSAVENTMVAIMGREWNKEDGLILNQSSIDLGMFRSICCRTTSTKEGMTKLGPEKIQLTKDVLIRKHADYSKLDADGLIRVGCQAVNDTILVPKTKPAQTSVNEVSNVDVSVTLRATESGRVDKVLLADISGRKGVRVRTVKPCIPQIGDKFATRHGQKGVGCMVFTKEDLPFTQSGEVPDIVATPIGLPSRMTWGQIYEGMMSLVACHTGHFVDGTPHVSKYREAFGPNREQVLAKMRREQEDLRRLQQEADRQIKDHNVSLDDEIRVCQEAGFEDDADLIMYHETCAMLHSIGMTRTGDSVMFDPHTGEKISSRIFMAPIAYQALRHRVEDKLRARQRGATDLLTKQPTKGRAKDGGLVINKMEFDSLVASGAAAIIHNKTVLDSDPFWMHVCMHCQFPSLYRREIEEHFCMRCGQTSSSRPVLITHGLHRMQQEIMAAGMDVTFTVVTEEEFYQRRFGGQKPAARVVRKRKVEPCPPPLEPCPPPLEPCPPPLEPCPPPLEPCPKRRLS